MSETNFHKNKTIEHNFYDATKTLPVVNPTEKEDKRLGIYKWGEDNLYPNYLASLYYNCAIHNGVIRSKVHYTVSGGLIYEGPSQDKFLKFFKNGNSDFDMNEVSAQLSMDLELWNAYSYLVTYVNNEPFQIEHITFGNLRQTLEDEWEYSEDWSDKRAETITYSTLNPLEKEGQQLVVFMEKPIQIKIGNKLTSAVYPAPPYSGGILAIETDIEINNYRRNEIYNNFSLGTIVNFNNGQPATKNDKDAIIDNLQGSGQGSSNAGGVMAVFNNGKDNETTVTQLTGNNLDARYLALSKDNKENILLAHSVTNPMLSGIKTEGQLGGASELETSYNLMKRGYFKYRQRAILSTFNYIFNRLYLGAGKMQYKEVELDLPQEKAQTNTFNFSKDVDPVFLELAKVGKPKDKSKILLSRELDFDNFDEDGFLSKYKTFAPVTDMQVNVLSMIHQGNDFDGIRNALNIQPSNLSQIYDNLSTEGMIDGEKVTSKGMQLLASSEKVKLTIQYSYEVRPELGQPEIIPTTRDFCRDVIGLDRVYTRLDIDSISNLVDRDVWRYRGGWYHNPTTNKTTKSCRHYWQQNIILE